jgi:hypothetical protein
MLPARRMRMYVCAYVCVCAPSFSPQCLGACATVCEGVDVHFVDGYESITRRDLATLNRWAAGYQRAHLRSNNPVHAAASFFCTRFCCTSWAILEKTRIQTCRPPSGLPTKTIPTPASCVFLDSTAAFRPAHVTSLLATAALTAQSCHPRNPCAGILAQATTHWQTHCCARMLCASHAHSARRPHEGLVCSWVVARTRVLQSTSAPLFTRLDLAASETG